MGDIGIDSIESATPADPMRIAVIGAGSIGRTLGAKWTAAGHEVVYGVRSPGAPDTAAVADAVATAEVVTLAVPESLQPLFAAKVVEATTMALPEDDVEEVDPEPAIARILDHDHDAMVVGPGLRPGLATAELVRMLLQAPEQDHAPAPMVLDAEALRSMATLGEWWSGSLRPCG